MEVFELFHTNLSIWRSRISVGSAEFRIHDIIIADIVQTD